MVNGRPQYYNHQLNLYKWIYNPGEWAFTARGVYARENMFPGCKVLDLCCGDGSYSYLFFSDIAGAIDAVDIDQAAINNAVKYYSSPNINYCKLDIINEKFPSTDYDFVIWNAAICYFDITEIHEILNKIQRAGNSHMNLYGVAPVATGYVDHKTEFNDANELRELLLQYFTSVHIKQINEITINNIHFHATDPIKYPEKK
jgi:ubiquinone/menaquinone biosynthesis C-methylase UbiE